MSGASGVDRSRLADLLASRNGGVVTVPMREFARLAPEEISWWQDFDPAEYDLAVPALCAVDRPEWFGPQFGRARTHGVGRGGDVLAWFTRIGRGLGVEFVTGDAALVMFHIHGNCNSDGSPRTGGLETDPLADGQVYLRNVTTGEYTVPDPETTALLAEHRAHYHFPDIAQRFLRHGGIARVVLPHGAPHWGRVAHHYSHLAVATVDGVAVTGSTNLIAVGDAAGTGHWSAHQVRYPGVALATCLLTARLAQEHVMRHEHRPPRTAAPSPARAAGSAWTGRRNSTASG